MTSDQLKQVLDRYADAKSRHAPEEIVDLLTEDSVYEDKAFGTTVEGKEALREWYTRLFKDLPDYFGEFDGAAYGDNTAVVWGRWGGTLREELMGVKVEAGRRLEVPVTFVCIFREDGLLERDTGYFDSATLRQQAGIALPEEATASGAPGGSRPPTPYG
jgi:steroid delta-isomerase-like uncharacterized protein